MRRRASPVLRTIVVLLVVALAGVLSSCGERTEQSDSSSAVVHLTYWPAPNPQEVQLADTLVRRWNRMHPEIQVTMQPIPVSQSTEEVLMAAIAGKTTPDVCSNIQPGAIRDYTKPGGVIPLDEFPDFDSLAQARIPTDLMKPFRGSDGHFYQMPWKTNPVMMYYNLRMFQQEGIQQPPRTYSEFYADAKKLTRDLDGDGQIDVWAGERDIRPIWWQRLFDFVPFYIAASSGGTLLRNGQPDFGNEAAVQVFTFFQECYQKNYFPHTYFQGGDPFILQKKATNFAGPWMIATIRTQAPQLPYDVAPIPVPDDHTGPVYTYGDYKNIAIFGTTKHPREAWEFVKYLLRPEHDLLLLTYADQIPVRNDLLTNPLYAPYFRKNPMMTKFAQQAAFTRSIDAAPDLKEILDALSQEYEACAVYGKLTPAAAVQDAVNRTKMIIKWNE